jgi:hypothetical protein
MPSSGHCAVCEKEARDDAEVRSFQSSVTEPAEGTDLFRSRTAAPLLEVVVGWLGRVVFRQTRPSPEKPFEKRTPEDIREWRRTAGVKTRG